MRVKYLAPVAVLLLILTWSIDSRAQDDVPGPDLNGVTTTDPNSDDEKPLLLESEGKTSSKPAIDSTGTRAPAIAPVRKVAAPAEAKKKEESDPLNFNFLFYIIQTFKSSDLMMEN